MMEIKGSEVAGMILGQIGELRVPMREKELRDGLDSICMNLSVLKSALEKAEQAEVPDEAEVREDV